MPDTDYEAVIGLEIHVQLNTRSKLFCGCSTEAAFVRDVPPNTHICPICTGHPGVLPRPVNRRAVALAVRLAAACGCAVQPASDFDRKNYFYPDLPKGYQITQHQRPLATGGGVDIAVDGLDRRVCLKRMHIEEDPGRSRLEDGVWLVDMNRCGVPLVEIVTQPDLRSAAEAAAFMHEFRRIVRYLGVSEGNMEMGNLRCDANVSIRPAGTAALGTKTEIKNLNSFRFLEDAIAWEIRRQEEALRAGETIRQVTISWDERAGTGRLSREKETEADYRYYREPNLIPVVIDESLTAEAVADLPALPHTRLRRYIDAYGLKPGEASDLVEERSVADYLEAVVAAYDGPPKRAADWVRNHVLRTLNDARNPFNDAGKLPVTPGHLAELLTLIASNAISESMAYQVFEKVLETGLPPGEIVEREGLRPPEDDVVAQIIDRVIAEDPETVQRYREGNTRVINRLIGQAMRLTQGRADAKRVKERLIERLDHA